jgi:hypothetical protein
MAKRKTQTTSPARTSDPVRPITTAPHQPKTVRGKLTVHQHVLTLSKGEDKKRKFFGSSSVDDTSDLFPSQSEKSRGNLIPLLLAPLVFCVLLYSFVNIGAYMTKTEQIPEPSFWRDAFCVVLDISQTFGIDVDDEQEAARCVGTSSTSVDTNAAQED